MRRLPNIIKAPIALFERWVTRTTTYSKRYIYFRTNVLSEYHQSFLYYIFVDKRPWELNDFRKRQYFVMKVNSWKCWFHKHFDKVYDSWRWNLFGRIVCKIKICRVLGSRCEIVILSTIFTEWCNFEKTSLSYEVGRKRWG